MRTATYRLQLNAGFSFREAKARAHYLAGIGVSHLYLSPILQAAAGSTHGYDVVSHSTLNRELGGDRAYRELVEALAAEGLGILLDIVPNHMALAGPDNLWWWDVLENGPSSPYAPYFDVEWERQEGGAVSVLAPVLGDHYGRVLEDGELWVERHGGSFLVRYRDHTLPLSPESLDFLLAAAAGRAASEELATLAFAFRSLPSVEMTDPAAVAERHRVKELLRARLAEICSADAELVEAIDTELGTLNADADALDSLLRHQNFRLAFWRTASEELDYRRFFNIETLIGLRVEDPQVFEDTHRLILDLLSRGTLDGLRVDHVDGLRDPQGYLQRLAEESAHAYVLTEKILQLDEELPAIWPVAGTTGYDFANRVNNLFVDQRNEETMTRLYHDFSGGTSSYDEVVHAAKLQNMRHELAAEVDRLVRLLAAICENHRRHRDHTRRDLRDAIREVIAGFSVYRTYVQPGTEPSESDRAHVGEAVGTAAGRRPDIDRELLEFIGELLLLEHQGDLETELALRFQQVSAPVMAKGVEDTAFYRYNRLISLNEVGGDPGTFGRSLADFHADNARFARTWPETMLTLDTHDTKRSGDVRARINVLSEIPGAWEVVVSRWADHNQKYKAGGWPERNTEYLLYQTLVGAWPIDAGRVAAFMHKASKEAKVLTSWTDPVPGYDAALTSFVNAILGDREFLDDLERFLEDQRLVERGRTNSLAQTALLLTCPGVPDIYQGCEIWDLSLVDPDNRRPVDYERRARLLTQILEAGPIQALACVEEGGPKLWLIHRLLQHRRSHPEAFGPGAPYEPLEAGGDEEGHLVAFARGPLVVLVPRLVVGLRDGWRDTWVALPEGAWTDVLTGARAEGKMPVEDLLIAFPVAVLAPQV
jgi:(1->4)-alpha-D-glucan 1-alpha-D-glucosylmutase